MTTILNPYFIIKYNFSYYFNSKSKTKISIPHELMVLISSYLHLKELYNFCFIYKEAYQDCIETYKEKLKLKKRKNLIDEHFCKEIIDIISYPILLKAPFLKWHWRFKGTTDYIDNIRPEDMSAPIMIGVGDGGRAYIAIRWQDEILKEKNKIGCDVLFQRYYDYKKTWSNGYSSYSFIRETGHFLVCGNLRHTLLKQNIYNLTHNINEITYPTYRHDMPHFKRKTYLI